MLSSKAVSGHVLLVAAVLGIAAIRGHSATDPPLRDRVSLNGKWLGADVPVSRGEAAPETGWDERDVPGMAWRPARGGARYLWVRRDIDVPAAWENKRVYVVLMGARHDPHVYIDGRLVASRLQGFTPFEIEITDSIEAGRKHRLDVRCQDWSATFDESVQSAEGQGGFSFTRVDSDRLHGKVLVPVGGFESSFGPWDDVWLECRPRFRRTSREDPEC